MPPVLRPVCVGQDKQGVELLRRAYQQPFPFRDGFVSAAKQSQDPYSFHRRAGSPAFALTHEDARVAGFEESFENARVAVCPPGRGAY
jgi:hypothetical protein